MQRLFGQLADGSDIHALQIGHVEGPQLELLTYGGILRRLTVPTRNGPVEAVLSLPDLPAYLEDRDHLGTLVGRFGNRIAGGHLVLDGHEHWLSANEGANHLHGGHRGFGRRVWSVRELAGDRVVLGYRAEAGEEGYPGALDVTAEFVVSAGGFVLSFEARADAPTVVNLTHHPYFNLAGDARIAAAAQRLRIPADRFLVVDQALIPTGVVASVDGSPFDLRVPSTLEQKSDLTDAQLRIAGGFDHCLVLAADADCTAEVHSPHSGVAMRINSPMPAVQLYGGHGLDQHHPGSGRGICLEPQGYPDAPNRADFPSAVLRPGEVYRHRIEYRLVDAGADADWGAVRAALDRVEL